MLASFAEFERATITERSRDGLHRAFKNGKHIGRIPLRLRRRRQMGSSSWKRRPGS
jgi:DNA invertase Pin-like site-specific DNA recombinase